MHKVEIAPTAVRDLDKIRDPDISRIRSRILTLESNPRPPSVKKLEASLYRLRVGDWRIIFAIDDGAKTATILRVLRRSERTYKKL